MKQCNSHRFIKSIILLLMIFCVLQLDAQYNLDISKATKSTKLPSTSNRNIEYVDDGVIITYTFKDVLSFRTLDSEGTYKWMIPGFFNNQKEGFPDVPSRTDVFTIPKGYDITYSTLEQEYIDYEVSTSSSQHALPDLEDVTINIPKVTMAKFDGFYPSSTVCNLSTEYYRGQPIYRFSVNPVQYNKEEGLTRFYTKLKYKVTYKPTNNISGDLKTDNQPKIASNSILNRIGLPLIKNNANDSKLLLNKAIPIKPTPYSKPGEKLLIITNIDLEPAASLFSEWKRCMGYNVDIEIASQWTVQEVKNAIKSRYEDSLDYVLIIGDDKIVPAQEFYKDYHTISPTDTLWTPYYISDHPYVCMDGENDTFADIHIGRIPASNLEKANNAIFKIMRYEMQPPMDSEFYNNGVHTGELELKSAIPQSIETEFSRFIFTSENIRKYLMSNYPDMNISHIYSCRRSVANATQFKYNLQWTYNWGKKNSNYPLSEDDLAILELMPDEMQNPSFWLQPGNGRATFYRCFSTPWNAGLPNPSYVFYSGHGNINRWGCPYVEVEANLIGHGLLDMITQPIMLFSVCCQNGKFNYPNCLAKAWIESKGGAVGVFAASHFTWLMTQFPQVEVMMNCIWPKGFITPLYGTDQNSNYFYEDFDVDLGTDVAGALDRLF